MGSLIENDSPYLNKLDYPNLNTREKALIDSLIPVFSQSLEKYLNRVIVAADYTEYYDGDNANILYVNNPPINSLTSITVRSSTDTVINGSNFELDSKAGIIRWKDYGLDSTADIIGIFPRGYRNIKLIYNGGWVSVPEELQFIVAEAIIQVFDRREGFGQLENAKLGNQFFNFGKDHMQNLIMSNKKILSMYKRRWI